MELKLRCCWCRKVRNETTKRGRACKISGQPGKVHCFTSLLPVHISTTLSSSSPPSREQRTTTMAPRNRHATPTHTSSSAVSPSQSATSTASQHTHSSSSTSKASHPGNIRNAQDVQEIVQSVWTN